MSRQIKKIIPAQKVNMGGHILDQPLPAQSIDAIDPFLLIHHWKSEMPGNQKQKEVGVGPHPHRGFSPVTFVFKGNVEHRDSLGNQAVVEAGGTQWMHAGRGITHSERPSAAMANKGGELEFIQFWVNTPSKYKMETPYYLPILKEETPTIKGEGYTISVVAGEYEDIKGPARTYSPQILLRGNANKQANFSVNLPKNFNTILYILEGKMSINNQEISTKDMVWFENNAEEIQINNVEEDTVFIVLSGEPIQEEVSSYGPFVMNTQTEILEALRDSQMGKMGILIEEFEG